MMRTSGASRGPRSRERGIHRQGIHEVRRLGAAHLDETDPIRVAVEAGGLQVDGEARFAGQGIGQLLYAAGVRDELESH